MGRGHRFQGMEAIQSELSPVVRQLVPPGFEEGEHSISFLGVGDGQGGTAIGRREMVREREGGTEWTRAQEEGDQQGPSERVLLHAGSRS